MDIIQMGTKLLADKFGDTADLGALPGALQDLLAGEGGDLDIGGLVEKLMQNQGVSGLLGSWLGDGANESLSVDHIFSMFGGEKIQEFASSVGVETDTAAEGLAQTLPDLIDNFSEGGSILGDAANSLLEKAGGASGLMGMAKGFFSK